MICCSIPAHPHFPWDSNQHWYETVSQPAGTHLLTIAKVCALSFSANTELVPWRVAIISLASRSSRVCPGRFSHALRIHLTAYRVRCFSLSAMGRDTIFPPWVWDILRTAGAARRTAWRTMSRGGARVREWTHRSMRETMRDARLRLPWRIIVFAMNWSRGSSAGGMSSMGGGGVGVASGCERELVAGIGGV